MPHTDLLDAFAQSGAAAHALFARLDRAGITAHRFALLTGARPDPDHLRTLIPADESDADSPRIIPLAAPRTTAHATLAWAAHQPLISEIVATHFTPVLTLLRAALPALQGPASECTLTWVRRSRPTRPRRIHALVRVNFAYIRPLEEDEQGATTAACLRRVLEQAQHLAPATGIYQHATRPELRSAADAASAQAWDQATDPRSAGQDPPGSWSPLS